LPAAPAAGRGERKRGDAEEKSESAHGPHATILTVAEVMGVRERRDEIGRAGELAGDRSQRLERPDDDVLVALDALEGAVRQDERLTAHDCPVALVHRRWD